MANITPACCRRLAEARRAKGLTQSTLAAEVGCQQSAISMLEAGHASKISQESVQRIATLLEVTLEPLDAAAPTVRPLTPLSAQPFCPQARCLSNIPYCVDGRLLFWPVSQPHNALACAVCGELLETRCPHCDAAPTPGACCLVCGQPKVTDTVSPDTIDIAAWATQQRHEIHAWRDLIR